jgi:hypothetical protein
MTGTQLQSGVEIVNHSSTECRLDGPPSLALFGSDGTEIGTNSGAAPAVDTSVVLMAPDQRVSPLHTATPGGEAAIGLVWSPQQPNGSNCLTSTPTVASMKFKFPGATGNLVVTKISASPLFAPCGAVEMVAFSATAGSTPASVFTLVAKLADAGSVLPGHPLKYRLLLRNPGKTAIDLRDLCPSFVEGLFGVDYKAKRDYSLNCAAARSIGPGQERIFAMQFPVPGNAPRGLLDLDWTPLQLPGQLAIAPPPGLALHVG